MKGTFTALNAAKVPFTALIYRLVRMGEDGWWYCLTHGTVENTRRCRGADRMGPYPDKATAERALEIAREKTRAADEAERKWREGDDD